MVGCLTVAAGILARSEGEFKNHEISTVYMYEETVDITKLKLQKEEVEEVMWMDQEELIQKVRDGGIPNCIYLDEVEKF